MSDLDDVKPGDKVAYLIGYGRHWSVTTVERLTKTQIITANGRRWRRTNGLEVGGGYTRLRPVTPDIIESVRVAKARSTIDGLSSRKLTDEQVLRVAAAIKAALKEQPND